MMCFQDYHWWWRAFLTSGFTAVYFFIYCIHFYFTKLEMQDSASGFLYFGYTFIIIFAFFLLTGKWSPLLLSSDSPVTSCLHYHLLCAHVSVVMFCAFLLTGG